MFSLKTIPAAAMMCVGITHAEFSILMAPASVRHFTIRTKKRQFIEVASLMKTLASRLIKRSRPCSHDSRSHSFIRAAASFCFITLAEGDFIEKAVIW
jgi:hypothetical protein